MRRIIVGGFGMLICLACLALITGDLAAVGLAVLIIFGAGLIGIALFQMK